MVAVRLATTTGTCRLAGSQFFLALVFEGDLLTSALRGLQCLQRKMVGAFKF